ncbi:MAG: two-component regulator propeller domain-containing protein, partial [Bacteroidota bacterium]
MFSTAYSDSGIIDIEKDTIYSTAVLSKELFNAQDVIYVGNTGQNSNAILIVTRLGVIYKYDGAFKEIYRFPHMLSGFPRIAAANDGSYWIIYGENTAIIQVKHGKKIKTIPFGNTSKEIHRIVTTQPDVIIETYSNPIKYWKVQGDGFVPFSIAPHADDEIRQLFQIHQDYSCYGTRRQLLVRDTQGKIIYSFKDFEKIGRRVTLNNRKTLVDRQNILWITTENGLVKISVKKNHFETLQTGNSIRGIFTDGKQLWSGGYFGNTVTHIENNKAEKYTTDDYTVMAFHQDHRGHLWMGTNKHTLIEYIPDQDAYRYHEFTNGERPCIPFQNAVTKTYWMGTGYGLSRFDPEHKTMTPYPLPINVNVYINQFYQNIQGIWIATNKGIFLMDAEKEHIIQHYTTADGLPTNDINHIHEDTDGIFWLGTKDAGLVQWDRTTGKFQQFTRKDGLSNTKIYAVYEDDFQTLWLTSDYGLMAFDKNTLSTKVYLPQNGIAHEEFNTYAHFQAPDGTLYFGGLNGITKFHPRDLRETDDITAPLYATRLRVLEKDTEAFANRTKNYRATQKIRLKPTDRMLELELTLLDYEKSEENQYAYKFSKDQEQWIYTSDNILSIINPPYGRYDLVIKARGRSGNWSQNPLIIPMYVKKPFYMQWWFILFMVLVAIGSIIISVRRRVAKLKKDQKRLEKEVRKRTYQIERDKRIIEKDKQTIEEQAEALKALDKAKTHFFANITHEFRTPLTLVTGPVEQIITAQPPDSIKKRLKGVLKNARNLAELINQLLDISKLEAREMKIEMSHGDIAHYTKELISRFQPLA